MPAPLPIPVRRQFRCRRGAFSHSQPPRLLVLIGVDLVDGDSWWSSLSCTSLDAAPSGSAGRRADGPGVADRCRHRSC